MEDIRVRSVKGLMRFTQAIAQIYGIYIRHSPVEIRVNYANQFVHCGNVPCAVEMDHFFRVLGRIAAVNAPDTTEGRELVSCLAKIYSDNQQTFLQDVSCIVEYFNLRTATGKVMNSDFWSRRFTQFLEQPLTAIAKELKNPTQEGTFLWIGGLVRGVDNLTMQRQSSGGKLASSSRMTLGVMGSFMPTCLMMRASPDTIYDKRRPS
jgi:hypothetical protein